VDVAELAHDLARRVDAEVRFDAGSRSAYSTDASNYRAIPLGVVVPRTVEAAAEAVAVCREHDAPVLSRGGGTSLAGQCTNVGVVLDWSKYCNSLLSVDVEARRCVVEPGIVLDVLNRELWEHDLEYGPQPATHSHCTIGGMIGNNSCGATAQRTGKVVDNIERLEVLLYDGTRMWVGPTSGRQLATIQAEGGRRAEIYRDLQAMRDRHLVDLRDRYPKIPRRVSGYNLDSLLPENDFHVAQALVGSEGTLVTVLRAELRLVPRVKARTMVVLGYQDIATAADAVPQILPHGPIVLDAMDRIILDSEQKQHRLVRAIDHFPTGDGFLFVQLGGETNEEARANAQALLDTLGKHAHDDDVRELDDEAQLRQVWQVRESALGASARAPGAPDAWPGWEDSAVAPDRLGDYLRALRRLYDKYGYQSASIYGHFGQGCVHSRIPFDLVTADGVRDFRSFVHEAADTVVAFGGSLSGEHGDGQARGELLPKMFGDEIVRAFAETKAIFDPRDRMNPGKVVAPRPLDADLRLGSSYEHPVPSTYFAYPHDDGDFGRAALRCVGAGNCRRVDGGVMCPSYMVTRDEEHSTRGRARLLFEMLDGSARGGTITDGWRSQAVHDALDLCFACKGCKSDCPVNVDMATYKAEFLAHHYERRLRPRSHYSMGWLPVWAWLASFAPRASNVVGHARVLQRSLKALAGIAPAREVPFLAPRSLQAWYAARGPRGDGARGEVLLWADTFTNRFAPQIGEAAVQVLEDAGWRVTIPETPLCCGLTWISTGQLSTAQRVLRRTARILRPWIDRGVPVVGLEPSCTAVFRSDATELLPRDASIARLRDCTFTLAELLLERSPGWNPPHIDGRALVQMHCHQHAVMTFDADAALLRRAGVDPVVLDSGCCGLAGNFGFEAAHYDISVAAAERVLLPALREAEPADLVLADGFSCRTQIEQCDSGGRRAVHLAELLVGIDGRAAEPR
jgi:FAD/FMN-containing dehydrogenase/Fe-S oxidoreductase